MEKLVLDGKEFVKAARVAKDLGYTADYVGQLCRSGKVSAHLVGRSWYVNKEELSTHKVEKKRISRTKAREQARKSIEEYKILKIQESNKAAPQKKISIRYEQDDSELIPETRKLEVSTEKVKVKSAPVKEDKGPGFTLENEGEKVVMQGKLDVVDVTDGPVDAYTTFLTPKISNSSESTSSRSGTVTIPKQNVKEEIAVDTVETEELELTLRGKTDFKDRLKEQGAIESEDEKSIAPNTNNPDGETIIEIPHGSGYLKKLVVVAFILVAILSIATPLMYVNTQYSRTDTSVNNTGFSVSINKTFEKIRLKI